MIRVLLFIAFLFSPIFATNIEFKDVKMAGKAELWQKQLEQEGQEGWFFIEVNSAGWGLFARTSRKAVIYCFTKAINDTSRRQSLIDSQAKEGWRFHCRHNGHFIFSQLKHRQGREKLQCKFIKRSTNSQVWQQQVTQEGREGWMLVDVDKGWFIFVKDSRSVNYKFVKSASRYEKRREQIVAESKEHWMYLLKVDSWLIFTK